MDPQRYLDEIEAGGRVMVDCATSAGLDRPVPACPDWDLAKLLEHTGGVYTWATEIVRTGSRPASRSTPPADLGDLVPWFEQANAALVEELKAHAPEDPTWVFVPGQPQTVGWWYRRQAQETLIHQWDARSAANRPIGLPPDMAADGVDEYLMGMFRGALRRQPVAALTGTFHVHCTDTEGEWLIDLDSPEQPGRREHAKADTAVRGPASMLDLWLWNRLSIEEAGLEVFGDAGVVAAISQVRL